MSGRIVDIETYTVRVPLPKPFTLGRMQIKDREYCIVRVRDEQGTEGVSYGLTRNAPIGATVRQTISPAWQGADLDRHDEVYNQTVQANVCLGTHGIFWRALSLCDCALYDLLAKRAEKPLGEYLNGIGRPIHLLLVGGYPTPDETHDSLGTQVQAMREAGADGVKIASSGDPARDTARLKVCREVLGPDFPVMIDLFWQVQDPHRFAREIRCWKDLNLGWIEDPVAFDDYEGIELLRREAGVPIAVGDEQSGLRAFSRLMEPGRVNVVRLDATVCGGVRAFLKIAELADRHGLPVACHIFDQLHTQLAYAAPNVNWVERMPESLGLDSAHLLWRTAPKPSKPDFHHDFSGIGIEWDWNAVNTYRSKET